MCIYFIERKNVFEYFEIRIPSAVSKLEVAPGSNGMLWCVGSTQRYYIAVGLEEEERQEVEKRRIQIGSD